MCQWVARGNIQQVSCYSIGTAETEQHQSECCSVWGMFTCCLQQKQRSCTYYKMPANQTREWLYTFIPQTVNLVEHAQTHLLTDITTRNQSMSQWYNGRYILGCCELVNQCTKVQHALLVFNSMFPFPLRCLRWATSTIRQCHIDNPQSFTSRT